MTTQRQFSSFIPDLPIISEDQQRFLLQGRLCNANEHRQALSQYHCTTEHVACQMGETVASKDVLVIIKDDRPETVLRHEVNTAKPRNIDEVRALFPDFFQASKTRDSCEGSLWRAETTMEQIILRHDQQQNSEYWKKLCHLSF